MHSHTRRTTVTIIKIALAIAILAYLLFRARGDFAHLSERSLAWPFLAAALLFSIAMATLSFVRWHILVRALDINVRLVDSLRLGALGFALNFVSPGSIGGDFFKAVFLAHGHPTQRTEAVATVLADRILGLLTQLAMASCGILATSLLHIGSPAVHLLCKSILIMTVVGWIGFLATMIISGFSSGRIAERAKNIPVIGKTAARLLNTIHAYRQHIPMLLAAFCVSAVVALCFITTFYLIARGLQIDAPPWSQHVVIVPVAGIVSAIPLTPSGLGTMEFAVEELYKAMPNGAAIHQGDGTLVGLGRRATDIVVALAGLAFYLTHRREVDEVLAEAEELSEEK